MARQIKRYNINTKHWGGTLVEYEEPDGEYCRYEDVAPLLEETVAPATNSAMDAIAALREVEEYWGAVYGTPDATEPPRWAAILRKVRDVLQRHQ